MPDPIFIFMLTLRDETVPKAREVARRALAAGVRHIGFKDVGAPPAELRDIAADLKAAGAVSYLEVVSLDEASELASAELAMQMGVDHLLGGVRPGAVAPIVRRANLRYFPFAGRVEGHPSVLIGDLDEIVDSARQIAALPGVDGLDLLAYRFAGDVPALMARVCASAPCPVIVAGSIDGAARIEAVRRARAYGFTVGTAALEGAFASEAADLGAQLAAIEAARRGPAAAPRVA
jgi:4-hydroxythreonine-4-phosphate dehydrogenase